MTPIKIRKITEMEEAKTAFLKTEVAKPFLILNVVLALVYFGILAFWFPISNKPLFYLLIAGEVFHLWQTLTYLYTVWDTEYMPRRNDTHTPGVDVFITVCGEPTEIVEETLVAAMAMDYPNFKVYLLNDGLVAKRSNWQQIEMLAKQYGATCITRTVAGGAKAGNINNAIRETQNPLITIFDADHVPHKDFLRKTVGYFGDKKMGFVQSPQFYKNFAKNSVTTGAWEQQALFFGPICKGKNRLNAVTMCGTNMVISREGILQVGGMCEDSIAEDFVTGALMHAKGWKSCYVPEVLAEGLAPEDFLSYYKQQYRWARGAMDVIFRYNLFFRKGLTFAQRIQYLAGVGFFLSGVVVLMNALIPIVFFLTGLVPLQISTMMLASIFIPYIFVTLYVLQLSSNFSFTFKSLAFAMAGFTIHIKALWVSITGQKSSFVVTPKREQSGNFLGLVVPHMLYIALVFISFGYAIWRDGSLTPSLVTNFAWAVFNIGIFIEFIRAAMPAGAQTSVIGEVQRVTLENMKRVEALSIE